VEYLRCSQSKDLAGSVCGLRICKLITQFKLIKLDRLMVVLGHLVKLTFSQPKKLFSKPSRCEDASKLS